MSDLAGSMDPALLWEPEQNPQVGLGSDKGAGSKWRVKLLVHHNQSGIAY
jgi:hypothetical protein